MTKFLTANEVAKCLGVKPRTVRDWLRRGTIPGTILPSGDIRFNEAVIEKWINGRTIHKTKAAQPVN